MKLRYATWQAVSSKAQAKEDKVSLRVQLEACKQVGESRGWKHVKDYTVPGQTRTQWSSLYHAEKNIPALHELLEAASRHEFDVLVIYDLNRFRDLMRQVFDALCDCNIQLYIISDPREPVHPSEYTEERKNEVSLTVGLRDIISRSEVSSLRKHYRDKMPKRITDKRLHAGLGLPPYGYRKPLGKELDRNAVLVQVPEQVRILRRIKDWFLAGASLTSIAERLNEQKIASPRGKQWWYSVVSYLLANPYYAGIVSFGNTKRERDRRHGLVTRHKSQPVTATGAHTPVWDLATHHRLLAELERRGNTHPGFKPRQLARLLRCWCGSVLWAQTTPSGEYWRCASMKKGHLHLRDDTALQLVTDQIVHDLTHLDQIQLPALDDPRPDVRAEIAEIKSKIKRWMDLYEDDALEKDVLTERLSGLQARLTRTESLLARLTATHTQATSTRASLQELAVAVETLPEYYRTAPPTQVNADLHHVLRAVHISKDHQIKLEWK